MWATWEVIRGPDWVYQIIFSISIFRERLFRYSIRKVWLIGSMIFDDSPLAADSDRNCFRYHLIKTGYNSLLSPRYSLDPFNPDIPESSGTNFLSLTIRHCVLTIHVLVVMSIVIFVTKRFVGTFQLLIFPFFYPFFFRVIHTSYNLNKSKNIKKETI